MLVHFVSPLSHYRAGQVLQHQVEADLSDDGPLSPERKKRKMTPTAPQATAVNAKSTPVPGSRPGEPPFQMKIEPDKYLNIKWKPTPVKMDVKIENTLKSRQTFKIKCTDNDIFRVRPPLGFINPGETAKIRITCTSKTLPENDRHLFAIYHMKSDEDKKTARQVWTTESKPEGVTRLVVVFEEGDEKKDEKKEEKDDKEPKKEAEKDEKKPDGEKKESKEEEKKEEKNDDKGKKEEKMEEKKDEKMEEKKEEETKDEKKEEKKDDAKKKDDEQEAKEDEKKKDEKKDDEQEAKEDEEKKDEKQ
ncbi:unnamed protein product, partial [Mesorhabditis belari]|uniref:Major sperm protein n=1 Tax=Mesorhabditis belari TaxID=2138241 RepID=A0AAF3EX72_9BILA